MGRRAASSSFGPALLVTAWLAAAAGCAWTETASTASAAADHRNFATYVRMPDGVGLAVDVWLPSRATAGEEIPSIVEFTRYWRAMETEPASAELPEEVRQALEHGYAYVAVDVRGTGASFGVRGAEFSVAEARDMPHVIDWIAAQPWSNGKVVSMGSSYPGNTAEMAAIYRSPALVAALPRFTDFDWYASIVIPGGLRNAYITERWGDGVRMLDLNDAGVFGAHEGAASAENPRIIGVKPVDLDENREMLRAASVQHAGNRSLADRLGNLVYRDEYPSATSPAADPDMSVSIHDFRATFEAQDVPMYHWGSWFDAGTAAGVLSRFVHFDAPYRHVIGAWSHGANFDANPYKEKDAPVDPSVDEQFRQLFEFANTHMDARAPAPARELVYYTVGENAWKVTDTWPPRGHRFQRMWMGGGGELADAAPTAAAGADSYTVDFSAGSGTSTRWSTQLGGGDVWYGDRSSADALLLTYTSKPLTEDIEVTGTAVLSLQMSSSHEDGALIAYLEDVAPDGTVTMLTEGELRLRHRAVGKTDPVFGPVHSFLASDGRLLVPGQVTHVEMGMLPVSALVRKGHALRIALAGHDEDTFVRVPETGIPELQLHRNSTHASYIDLPVVERQDGGRREAQ
jgi:putative CocE/NonD family hydrolase